MKIVTTSRSLYLPLESPKKKREPEDRKKNSIWRNNGPKFYKLNENYKSTDPSRSMDPKHKNGNKTTRHILIQLLKSVIKRMPKKQPEEKRHVTTEEQR